MGGRKFHTLPITREDINELYPVLCEILTATGAIEILPIGSTGKVDLSSDVDIAVDHPLGRDHLFEKLQTLFGDSPDWEMAKHGSSMIICCMAQNEKWVQADIMVGNLSWLKWSRYSPAPNESPIKGMFRNLLLNAIARDQAKINGDSRIRYTFDWDVGMFLTTQTKAGNSLNRPWKAINRQLVTSDPYEVPTILLKGTFLPWTFEDAVREYKRYDRTGCEALSKTFISEIDDVMQTMEVPIEKRKENLLLISSVFEDILYG